MKAALQKKVSENHRRQMNTDSFQAAWQLPLSSIHGNTNTLIRRKPMCPCGGGCPRCKGEFQPKLKIGQPGDIYEQEADRVAESVVQPYPPSKGFELINHNFQSAAVMQLKPDSRSLPVPQWDQLPAYAQADLSEKGYGKAWLDSHSHNDLMRLTVLNLYVKLNSKGLNLWRFIDHEVDSQVGALQFNASDVQGLKATLRARDDFTNPEDSPEKWSSREMRASGSLHFKHFKDWPDEKVQAHIDQAGLLLKSKWWWLTLVVPLVQMGRHLVEYLGYDDFTDVFGIREILLKQGWDPQRLAVGFTGYVQRKGLPSKSGDCVNAHQTINQPEASSLPSIVYDTLHSPGQPLDSITRAFMESHFRHDFNKVQVHTGAKAEESARAVNALAYTVGNDVVFGAGQYRPGTNSGQRLLAHELTHVVQQNPLSAYPVTSQLLPLMIARSPGGKKDHPIEKPDTETTISAESQGNLSSREKKLLNENWLRQGTVGDEDLTGDRAKDIDILARTIISLRASLIPSASKDPLLGLDPAATRRDLSYKILIGKYVPQYYDQWDKKLQSGLSRALKEGCIRSKSSENIQERIRQLAWLYAKYGVDDWPDWYEKNIKPVTFLGMRIIWGLHTTAVDALRFAERRLKERLDRESPTWTLSFRGGTALAGGYNVRGWQGRLGSHDFGMAFDIQPEFNIEVRGAPGIAWETFSRGRNMAFAVRFLTGFNVSEFVRLYYEYTKAVLEKNVSPELSQRMKRETNRAVNASQSLTEAVAEEIEQIKNLASNALAWEEYGARLLSEAEKIPPKLYPPMFNRARAKRDPKLLRKDWEQLILTLHKSPSQIVKTKKGRSITAKKKQSPSPAEKGFFNIPVSVVETLTDPKQPANARFRWIPFHHFELANWREASKSK